MAPVPIRNLPVLPPPKLDVATTDIPIGVDGGLGTQRTARISWGDLQKSLPAGLPVADIVSLRTVNEDTIQDGQSLLVLDSYTIYVYHGDSNDPDDGSSRVKPDHILVANPGRWHRFDPGGCDDYSRIMSDTNGNVLTTQNGFVASAPCA